MASPTLNSLMAAEHAKELQRVGREARGLPRDRSTKRRPRTRRAPLAPELAVTIRFGFPDDAQALARLAALDSREVPNAPVLLCEVEGELWAAWSLIDDAVVADPFRPTVAVVELLQARARQLRAGGGAGKGGLGSQAWQRASLRRGGAAAG